MKKETVLILARHPLFRRLSQSEKAALIRLFVEETVGPNVRIFQENTQGNSLYVLIEGSVLLTREVDGSPVPLVTVKAGECFGEFALVVPGIRLLSAKTTTLTTYARLTHENFLKFCEKHPAAGMTIRNQILKQIAVKLGALEPLFQALIRQATRELNL